MSVSSTVQLAPNGIISGSVLTENGLFPVEGVQVNATRKSSNMTYSATTDFIGRFMIPDISYGLTDSFEFSAILAGHTFEYPSGVIELNKINPQYNDLVIVDKDQYTERAGEIQILNLATQPIIDEDIMRVVWIATSTIDDPIVELSRNGEVILMMQGDEYLTNLYHDTSGVPLENSNYQLRIYAINDPFVDVDIATTADIFPAVSHVDQLDAIPHVSMMNNLTGDVSLSWEHDSDNIDGFRIYRNGVEIVELGSADSTYLDQNAPYQTDLTYAITKLRRVGGVTYESTPPVEHVGEPVNIGALPPPGGVTTSIQSNEAFVTINWTAPGSFDNEYNYTGFHIYRNSARIGTVFKGGNLLFEDKNAQDGSHQYEVTTFKIDDSFNEIESAPVQAAAIVSYPDVPTPILLAFPSTTGAISKVNLVAGTPTTNLSNLDGWKFYADNVEIASVPFYVVSHDHFPEPNTNVVYSVRAFKEVDGQIRLSDPSTQSISIPAYSSALSPPSNIVTSQEYSDAIKLTWEYDDFIPAKFVIYRFGSPIDTLTTESREYFDRDLDNIYIYGITYEVQAIAAGEESARSGARGHRRDEVLIYGQVIDSSTDHGIAHTEVQMATGIQANKQTVAFTDSTGFYSFYMDRRISNASSNMPSISLYLSPGGCNQCLTRTINITPNQDIYEEHFSYNLDIPLPTEEIASVNTILCTTDSSSMSNILHWNMSSNHYDGVQISRGFDIVATIDLGEELVYYDSTGIPGISYDYLFQAYKTVDGTKVFSDIRTKEVSFPSLDPAHCLRATPRSKFNRIDLQWTTKYNQADYYHIIKNGELFRTVQKGEDFIIYDTEGIPGEQYEYTVIAYIETDVVISTSVEKTIVATFPEIGKVLDLNANITDLGNVPLTVFASTFPVNTATNYTLNHVQLEWNYCDTNVTNFKIYRNEEVIAVLDSSQMTFVDYDGLPGSLTRYSVSAIVSNDNTTSNESALTHVDIIFPEMAQPYLFDYGYRSGQNGTPDVGDMRVRWEYQSEGVDGFDIYVRYDHHTNPFQLLATVSASQMGASNEAYEYIDRQGSRSNQAYQIIAYKIVDEVKYESEPTFYYQIGTQNNQSGIYPWTITYPNPPEPINYVVTNELYAHGELHTWEMPNDGAYIDGFEVFAGTTNLRIAILPPGARSVVISHQAPGNNGDYNYWIRSFKNHNAITRTSDPLTNYLATGRSTVYNNNGNHVVTGVDASDGTLPNTEITWTSTCSSNCNNGSMFHIFRDGIRIGEVPLSESSYVDAPVNHLNGIDEAITGKEYLYEVANHPTYTATQRNIRGDKGYSARNGRLGGQVLTFGSANPVPGVSITATGFDVETGNRLIATTTSILDGSFEFDNLYYGESGIKYILSAELEDHEFVVPDTIILTQNPSLSNIILDLDANVVQGYVRKQDSDCGLENIMIVYSDRVNGIVSGVDSVLTNSMGFYNLIIDPVKTGLQEIIIEARNIEIVDPMSSNPTQILHSFTPINRSNILIPSTVAQETLLDFEDQLTYPININVINTCEIGVADQPVELRIFTLDNCYDETFQTDNFGHLTVNLTPQNYQIIVTDLVGPGNSYENAAIDYLKLRPSSLDLLDLHIAANGSISTEIDMVDLVYHRAPEFDILSSFDRYLCDDSNMAAIVEQGDGHSMAITISELDQFNNPCFNTDGYIIIRNGGALTPISEPIVSTGNAFEYSFVAGVPNLIAPHIYNINIQYFTDEGVLLGSKSVDMIVEGSVQLPGTGIQTTASGESGNVNLPLFVLRDPPGDKSSVSIESGSSIKTELTLNKGSQGDFGAFTDGKFAIAGAGMFGLIDIRGGRQNKNKVTYGLELTTSEKFSTSSSNGAVGRDASVIVGAGLSTQFGLQRVVEFPNNCDASLGTILSYGIGGFESQYVYTIEFIEDLIDDYIRDQDLISRGLLKIIDSDGQELEEGLALQRFEGLQEDWQDIIHFFDVETTPHYLLCADDSFIEQLDEDVAEEYDAWRQGFCTLIGEYQGDVFTMDEEITWTPTLIDAYNNTVAFTQNIKDTPSGEFLNGDLELGNNEIDDANNFITQQYHGLLGTNLKSADIFDVSGGSGGITRTVKSKQSGKAARTVTRTFTSDNRFGANIKTSSSIFGFEIFSIDSKVGVKATSKASVGSTATDANGSSTTVKYTIADDDAEDQVTTLVLQGPMQNHSPYFIRLGGQSSCPYETALTPNQDNDPLMIDNPGITVVMDQLTGSTSQFPPKTLFVEPNQAAVYTIRITNSSATFDDRDVEIFLEQESNPLGAIVTLGGTDLNNTSKILSIDSDGSLDQILFIERPLNSPFYDFDNLRIGAKPACGGATEYIDLSVQFISPCSPISLTTPIDQFVVDRQNPGNPNDKELLEFTLRDYESDNVVLSHIQLQYRRLGTGSDWLNVPNGLISKSELASMDAQNAAGVDPVFFYNWDITGQYEFLPDGDYQLRAQSFCGVNGIIESNLVNGEIARSELLNTGYPEPADGIWTSGDEISSTYVTDIDCAVINAADSFSDYLRLYDLTTQTEVPFTYICDENKLILQFIGNPSDFDGHVLEATYQDISNLQGNLADDIVWTFRVVTQAVDWATDTLCVTMYEGDTTMVTGGIINATGALINGLSLSTTYNPQWLSYDPDGVFSVPLTGTEVDFEIIANSGKGVFYQEIEIDGLPGRKPQIVLKVEVVDKPEIPLMTIENPTDSMVIFANWRFIEDLELSSDPLDQIVCYIDGEVRGFANIEASGAFSYAKVTIYSDDPVDIGKSISFGIYNADESKMYANESFQTVNYVSNVSRGTTVDPEVLVIGSVEIDLGLEGDIIYVDHANQGSQDGTSWETAWTSPADAIAAASDHDQIWLASGTYMVNDVADQDIPITIDKALRIYGGFTSGDNELSDMGSNNLTFISGNIGNTNSVNDNARRVILVTGQDVLIQNLSIIDGRGDNVINQGIGILNQGKLTLSNVIINDCTATNGGTLLLNQGILTIDLNTVLEGSETLNVSPIENEVGATLNILLGDLLIDNK